MGSRQAALLRKLRESPLPNNPYMSPLLASDDILGQFPTTYLVVSNFISFYSYTLVQKKNVSYQIVGLTLNKKFSSVFEKHLNISGMSSRSFTG